MKTITVTLGGRQYQIEPLTIKKSREWRAQFSAPLSLVMAAINDASQALNVDIANGADLARAVGLIGQSVFGTLGNTIINSMDVIADMLFAYSATLASDRERIETEAYDDEVMAAFVEIVKLAYPFQSVLDILRNGPANGATSKS